jgi:hypothetical protein
MRRQIAFIALLLAVAAASGCDEESKTPPVKAASRDAEAPAPARVPVGKDFLAYAPATDFSGASPEDAASRAASFFDGSRMRDAVSANGGAPASVAAGGKRLLYTAPAGPRTGAGAGAGGLVPLPDDYDYSRSGATPGSAREAGRTLLEFASFQLAQRFPTIAPIMSRLGWNAGKRRGTNSAHTPYRVTVHHTDGVLPMTEAATAEAVREIQRYHMVGRGRQGKDNFSDIGYHFLIAGDGRVIEGRHAEFIGAHAGGANTGNIGIAMMGNFNKQKPTDAQIESLTRLVTFLAIKYKKEPDAKGFLEPHQHYTDTDCPGKNMMSILDALRRKIDHEKDVIMAGGAAGGPDDFTPVSVVQPPSA